MSATLRSFDVNDEGSIAFGRIPSPRLKSLHSRDQKNSESEKVNYDDDIEFDDTRMDITDTIRSNTSFRNGNLFNKGGRNGTSAQEDYIIRNTTTKVPLNDNPHTHLASKVTKNSEKQSTPELLSKINKHRSRNGTPLKLPPMSSNQFSSGSDGENNVLPVEQKIEDSLIKHRKLISDDNKFSPGSARVAKKDFSFGNSNGYEVSSPTKGKASQFNETAITPPPNLKVRPFIFEPASRSSVQARRDLPLNHGTRNLPSNIHDEDIEFDSSDADLEITDQNGVSITPKAQTSVTDQLSSTRPNDVLQHRGPTLEYNNDVSNPSKELSINKSYHEVISVENNMKGSPVNEKIPDQNEKYGDISRAEILEKINNTINSLMEREKNSSSPIKSNVGNVLPEDINGNVEREDASSDEAPEEILNELDSFFGGNKSGQQRNNSVSKYSLKSEEGDIQKEKPSKATPIRSHYSRLSGKYARQIIQRRKIGQDLVNNHQERSIHPDGDLETTEWSTVKWLKLNKVLQLEKLELKDILNSEVLFRSLGCTSKRELRQRVEFLIQFNKSRRNKGVQNTAKKIKKKNIAPKLSKTDKRFQIL